VGALINDKKVYDQISAASSDMRTTVSEAKVGVTAFEENMQALKKNWFFRGFFRNRGYEDSTELTKHEIAELPERSPVQKFSYSVKDIFDKSDTAKLKKPKLLDPVGGYLEQNSFGLAVVVAYTGLGGDHEQNLILSQARAMVVRQYLAENFKLDDTRIKTKGLGEEGSGRISKNVPLEILVYSEDAGKLSIRGDALSAKDH
jgi:outer membrane protein OmpA-like peptidoglycan-associated protein